MRIALHVLTRPPDEFVTRLIADQRGLPDVEVEVIDLTAGEPDYARLLERILSADSVATW